MRRTATSLVSAFGLVIFAGLLLGADTDAKGKKRKGKANREQARLRAQLPPGYRNLDLTKEQLEKIAEVRKKNGDKFKSLMKELADLRKAEDSELETILTPEQRTKLQENRERIRKEFAEKRAARKAKGGAKKKKSDDKQTDSERKKPEVKPGEK